VEPPAGDEPLTFAPAQTVELTLPVTGTWGVLQGFGGESHVGYATYALDLVPAEDRAKARPLASRKTLADFPCWGRDVFALAPGEVVWAHDGEADHPPFWPGDREPGNFVIVRHGADELTELRHLQRGSLAVKVGDRVARGQRLGRCGNSGNAHTPHVHLGFLGRLAPLATRPMRLSHYLVLDEKGRWRPGDGTPRTGQILQPAPRETGSSGPREIVEGPGARPTPKAAAGARGPAPAADGASAIDTPRTER
jgi:hypothetical protein